MNISKPNKGKGTPPPLEETPISNLEKPAKGQLVQLPLAIEPDLKKDIKMVSAETGNPMVTILMEGYQLWKEKHGIVTEYDKTKKNK